jgi:hypothetical protein
VNARNFLHIFPRNDESKWFWEDADCSEPMGPFDSYREAWNDFRELREQQPRSVIFNLRVPQ